jgi:hypothetical protein
MDWIAAQLSEPIVAAAVAFVLGGIFNSTATLVTGEIKASREEQRAIARERRENLRSDRLRVVEDTERWFRRWVDCLEEGRHDKIPDVADFPRRSHAVMANGELLLKWKEIEDLMIAEPHAMTPDEHRQLVRVKRGVLDHLEEQRERAIGDVPLVRADATSLESYYDHEPTGIDHNHP